MASPCFLSTSTEKTAADAFAHCTMFIVQSCSGCDIGFTSPFPEEAEVLLIEAMTAQPWLVTTAYRDPDLGPLLQGPAFSRLRENHPPPAPVKKPPMK